MKRISDEKFIETQPDKDRVIALKVEKGEFYFVGWMENAPNYDMQIAMDALRCKLDREYLIGGGDLFETIQSCDGYNNMYVSRSIRERDAYRKFLSYIKCYERSGQENTDDHDIFQVTTDEIIDLIDALRDGEYIFIIER